MESSRPSQGTPRTHPAADGLQQAIKTGVQEELDRRGIGGGGGGGGDRLAAIERDLAVLKQTVVTRDVLERELGSLRLELQRAPLTLVKWLGGLVGVLASITAIAFAAFRMFG